jgi:hypothetical protein
MNMKRNILKKIGVATLFLFPMSVFAEYQLLEKSFTSSSDLLDYIPAFLSWVVGLSTALAVFMIVYSGFMILLSAGDPGRLTKAHDHIKDAALGLAIIAVSYILLIQINGGLVPGSSLFGF